MANNFYGKENDPAALREMANASRQSAEESFQRCDTDGFLTQWASTLTAQLFDRQAEIAENGGVAEFPGLYEGNRRVAAQLIEMPVHNAPWRTQKTWRLQEDEVKRFGRSYVPHTKTSRIRKQLRLSEKQELAPAQAQIASTGTGLSGQAWVAIRRIGDPWGLDAKMVGE